MTDEQLIKLTKSFVKETLKNAEGGHDWFHTERVFKNALLISKTRRYSSLLAVAFLLPVFFNSGSHFKQIARAVADLKRFPR